MAAPRLSSSVSLARPYFHSSHPACAGRPISRSYAPPLVPLSAHLPPASCSPLTTVSFTTTLPEMATYNDPYAHGQYPQQYQDAPFNPYEVQQQQHAQRPYDQGGYSDPSDEYAASARAKESASGLRNGYGHGGDAVPVPMGEK